MKLKLLLLILALSLSACSSDNVETDTNTTTTDTEFVQPVEKVQNDVAITLSDEQIKNLDNQKWGYGQGVNLDTENRPYGALDFNNLYSKYNAIAITDNENKIFLTFDQGYENGYTSQILDILKYKNVKATFFVILDYVERNPELVQRMIDEGHNIGNHSMSHYSMPDCSFEENIDEIMQLHNYMLENFNYEMTMFRPPMGEYSEKTLAITQKCGYKTILWSYAYADWDVNNQMSEELALGKLESSLHNGAIYLLHSVSSTNTAILDDFIDLAMEKGYSF